MMTPDEFISAILPAARACETATGIPAAFTVAQGALESTWGTSELAKQAKNLFSIKADQSWHGKTLMMDSKERVNGKTVMMPAKWRLYSTWQECIDDRAAFFKNNPRYRACFAQTTAEGWARAVAASGYATDENYAQKLINTMHSHKALLS